MKTGCISPFFCFLPEERSVTEVPENNVSLWEEGQGRVEDELSPEEMQMVWNRDVVYASMCSPSLQCIVLLILLP